MTGKDFADILTESCFHRTTNSFFEKNRLIHECLVEEYIDGLKVAYKDIHALTYSNNIQDYLIGEAGTCFDVEFDFFNFHHVLDLYHVEDGKKSTFYFTIEDLLHLKNRLENYYHFIAEREKVKNSFNDPTTLNTTIIDYSSLLVDLSKNISGIGGHEFSNVIYHHHLSPGIPRAKWIGEKVDACYFADYLGMKIANWNKCFYFEDLKPLHRKHEDKLKMGSPIENILKKHLSK